MSLSTVIRRTCRPGTPDPEAFPFAFLQANAAAGARGASFAPLTGTVFGFRDTVSRRRAAEAPMAIKILLVDDNIDVAGMLADLLGHHGFEGDTAKDALAALERLTPRTCDLIA